MKKSLMVLCFVLMVMGSIPSAFAEYTETNANGVIDWYNIIDGVIERDYRSVSSKSHTPFHFSFNGFLAEAGVDYEMVLRHAGNRDNNREQWDLYLEGDDARIHIDDLVYSNAWVGSNWLWVDQSFLITAEHITAVGDNWYFSLEPGTTRYNVVDLDWAEISAVPVPGGLLLLASGLVGLAALRKK